MIKSYLEQKKHYTYYRIGCGVTYVYNEIPTIHLNN